MKKYFSSNKGASLIGTGLLIGLISAVAIGSVVSLGDKNSDVFETIVCNVNSVLENSEENCSSSGSGEETANLPPEITTTSLPEAYYLVPYSATLAATDPDSASLNWSSYSMIDGLSLDSVGNLAGSPTISGIRNMNVSVSDGSGNSDSTVLDLLIRKEKLIDPSFNASDEVGSAVAMSGDYVALGAKNSDDLGSNSGAVYIFDISNGEMLRKIIPESNEPGSEAGDQFGYSLAIDGTTLVIGSRKAEVGGVATGVVYTYDISTGTKLNTFTAFDGASNDNFGQSVAIGSNYVVVGAPGDDDSGASSGSVYIFDRSGNSLGKYVASDGAFGDSLGVDVAVSGNYIVASAQGDDDGGSNTGAVYLFEFSAVSGTVENIRKIYPSGTGYDLFEAVSISNTHIAVGARSHNANGVSGSGAVFVYSYNSFTVDLVYSLIADDSKEDLALGTDVQIYGSYLVSGSSEGAYLFNLGDGSQVGKFTRTINNGDEFDYFGRNIAVGNSGVLISAQRDGTAGSYAGAAYMFKPNGVQETWISNAVN